MNELYKKYEDLFNKSDLYEFLNIYSFVDLDEVYLAVCEFLDSKMEGIDRQGTADALDFAKEYLLENYSERYEAELDNFSDFYAEDFYIN